MSRNDPKKSIILEPYAVYQVPSLTPKSDDKTPIEYSIVKDKFKKTIQIVQQLAQWGLDTSIHNEDDNYFMTVYSGYHPDTGEKLPSKGNEAAKRLGYDYEGGKYYPQEMRAKSRIGRIVRGELYSVLKNYGERLQAFTNIHNIDDNTYYSAGRKRTISREVPRIGSSINTGYSDDKFYNIIIDKNNPRIVELRIIAYDIIVSLMFYFPESYISPDSSIRPPIINYRESTNNIKISFPVEYDRLYPEISSDYVLGVDIGQLTPYVISVIRTHDGSVVETIQPSLRVRSKSRTIRDTLREIRDIKKKYNPALRREKKYKSKALIGIVTEAELLQHYQDLETIHKYDEELRRQREALSRNKKELAKLVGQEVANVSLDWGNAVIAVEDLSFVENTTNNGRWNYGELQYWIKHYANLQGLLCYEIDARNTSKICHKCSSKNTNFHNRNIHCHECGLIMDRDDNASINIGRKVIDNAVKSSRTRNTKRKQKKIKKNANHNAGFIIRTPSHRESLKKRAAKHSTGSNMKRVKPRVSDVSLMGLKSSCRDYLDKKESGVNESIGSFTERSIGSSTIGFELDCDRQPYGVNVCKDLLSFNNN